MGFLKNFKKQYATVPRLREAVRGYAFISPWIFGFLVFVLVPLIAAFILGFYRWGLLSAPEFIGLENYEEIFLKDDLFFHSLKVTSIYVGLSVPLSLAFSLFLAMLVNRRIRGIRIFRTLLLTPYAISGVAAAIVWMWVFNANYGILNYFLGLMGLNGPNWLFSRTWALPALIIVNVWYLAPARMLIFLAGLQGIPQTFYESASVDGAGWWTKFWRITIPLLSPVIFFNLLISLIDSFKMFSYAYVMTGGGPANSTLFYILYIYQKGFVEFEMGYASALAWILFIIILMITLLLLRSSSLWVYYETEVKV